jgi:hypothetical protein
MITAEIVCLDEPQRVINSNQCRLTLVVQRADPQAVNYFARAGTQLAIVEVPFDTRTQCRPRVWVLSAFHRSKAVVIGRHAIHALVNKGQTRASKLKCLDCPAF